MPLKVLTFNIWFSEFEMVRRMRAIGNIISDHKPNVVALQEMTQAHWRVCSADPTFEAFIWSEPPPNASYFTLIGSSACWQSQPTRYPFEASLMDRDLLFGTVSPPSRNPLTFATSHFESLSHAKTRRSQISETLELLDGPEDVVFCGDTNINEAVDGEVRPPEPWKDAWLALRPGESGYTYDVEKNTMMAAADEWARSTHAMLRFDRFWVKLQKYKLASIQLLDEPVDEGVWPSDHFGLLLTLEDGLALPSERRKCNEGASCTTV
eukprot:TRINITY_DN31174_c0_g1_i1.p1 TRINITY_DN31174_c0_g1~~TRINITY_DN31174_c0_g1_i1.p1  ORF type:complete len:266 (+),score=36.22 TRINITY_DN31174_c0_g1_i1:277-1074(+)